ncbi:MAG: glycosyltransferase family 87 protein [Candidatus Limnocylindrales bacterium]
MSLLGLFGAIAWRVNNGLFPVDTLVYWLAGHRLDIGHALYDLLPSDNMPLQANTRLTPLFSPPLIGVPWRALAMLPGLSGMILWWGVLAAFGIGAAVRILVATRGWGGLLLILLVPSYSLLIGVGNVDAFVLASLIGVWIALDSGRYRAGGAIIGLLASLKLTPAVLIVWLITTKQWRALRWALATCILLAIVTAVVIGPWIFTRYLRVMIAGTSSGQPGALLVLMAGFIGLILLRRNNMASFALAVLLMPLGSPQVAGHSWSMLLGSLAPLATRSLRPIATHGGQIQAEKAPPL